jgi:hypothetical protein
LALAAASSRRVSADRPSSCRRKLSSIRPGSDTAAGSPNPPDENSTYVVMEETGSGLNPKKLAASNPGHVHRGHDLWNISLKFLCESTQD